jgi:hypothetical protein
LALTTKNLQRMMK